MNQALQIFHLLEQEFPSAKTELKNWQTPFQFLVCIILSAQATDKQVNKVTATLFQKYPTVGDFAKAEVEDVAKLVRSINYFNSKSKYIVQSAKMVVEEFDGKVPETISELVKLSGVGYKTANVFLNELYQANQGIAVDTHVKRVAQRLGWTKQSDPDKIAKDLEKLFPKDMWYKVNTVLVLFGRYICTAKNPKCDKCPVRDLCTSKDKQAD